MRQDDEELSLRSAAMLNATTILQARQRAEQELIATKDALEHKSCELAYTVSLMRAALESTWDGILVTDHGGKVTDFNEKFVQMWRLPRHIIESRQHRRVLEFTAGYFGEPQQFLARINEICTSSPAESLDELIMTDGQVFERFSKIQFVNERSVGRVWSFRDITENRTAEKERLQLLESERAARGEAELASCIKDQFLTTLSHELRTPLNAILGWSQLLQHRNMDETARRQGLATVERNARVQCQLIDDLLDMSRIMSGELRLDIQAIEPVSFIEAAIETLKPAASAKEITLEKRLDPATGPVFGDASRLQQVVWNLLSNAIKFTPKGGKVSVVLQRVNSHIEISVADTGVGISSGFLPHVFDRFRQEDASTARLFGGLGLGLSIVKYLIELHGGAVAARSRGEGYGTTFVVQLTLGKEQRSIRDRTPAPALQQPSDIRLPDLSGVKVLVVDDDSEARDQVKRILAACNGEVLTVGTASEALLKVEAERPQILISALGTAGLDGYDLLKKIRALGETRGGRVSAIALAHFACSDERTRTLRAGFLTNVSKPIDAAELTATVASVAGRLCDA